MHRIIKILRYIFDPSYRVHRRAMKLLKRVRKEHLEIVRVRGW